MENYYAGEDLLPGIVGQISVSLAFAFAFLAIIAYFFNTQNPLDRGWKTIGRISFYIHSAGILGIIGSLFYIIYHHRFEYYYAWAHSSLDLPTHFMISSFWEGQEGSFLLWAFWHVVLGLVLIAVARKWESPVMAVISLAQVTLVSMLLGVELLGAKLGSNPFILLREAMPDDKLFERADYLSQILDGNGLNPLLQNYWMVIHPPVLFLGFAASIVPFAYAIGGLWTKNFTEWIKDALPWVLFTVMILGVGILMGGAWAYEALNFGGFWAWDPVENASLVPWLIIVGGLHTMVIFRSTKRALVMSYIFVMLSFITVLYATFLTRSGILGDTSVHSFTDLGLSGQLLWFIGIFIVLAVGLMVWRYKELPLTKKEDAVYSREFWMFIGSLVLFLSAFQVLFSTSIPVFNQITGLSLAPPSDPIDHYNRFQLPFAIIITLLTGGAQYLKYRTTSPGEFLTKIRNSALVTLVLSVSIVLLLDIVNPLYMVLIFSCTYAIAGNTDIFFYMLRKGKISNSGAAVAHIGIGFLLLGALVSQSQKEVISINRAGIDFGDAFDEKNKRENIMLIKDRPVVMGDYVVTYRGDSFEAPNTYYKVEYQRLKSKEKEEFKAVETFYLEPYAQINPKMKGLIASPDTRHYLHKDVYTHVTSVPDKTVEHAPKYTEPEKYMVSVGDTIRLDKQTQVAIAGTRAPTVEETDQVGGITIGRAMQLNVITPFAQHKAEPLFMLKGNRVYALPAEVEELGYRFEFTSIEPEQGKLELHVSKDEEHVPNYIIMKAIVFPFINLLWLGSLIMAIGTIIAIVQRARAIRRS